jgi:hypothetical protein
VLGANSDYAESEPEVAASGAALAEALQAPELRADYTTKPAGGVLARPSLAERSRVGQRRWLLLARTSRLLTAHEVPGIAAKQPPYLAGGRLLVPYSRSRLLLTAAARADPVVSPKLRVKNDY